MAHGLCKASILPQEVHVLMCFNAEYCSMHAHLMQVLHGLWLDNMMFKQVLAVYWVSVMGNHSIVVAAFTASGGTRSIRCTVFELMTCNGMLYPAHVYFPLQLCPL